MTWVHPSHCRFIGQGHQSHVGLSPALILVPVDPKVKCFRALEPSVVVRLTSMTFVCSMDNLRMHNVPVRVLSCWIADCYSQELSWLAFRQTQDIYWSAGGDNVLAPRYPNTHFWHCQMDWARTPLNIEWGRNEMVRTKLCICQGRRTWKGSATTRMHIDYFGRWTEASSSVTSVVRESSKLRSNLEALEMDTGILYDVSRWFDNIRCFSKRQNFRICKDNKSQGKDLKKNDTQFYVLGILRHAKTSPSKCMILDPSMPCNP